MEKKTFLWWIVFVLLVIWQLPQFIISLIMMLFLGNLKLIRDGHYNFCFIGEKMSGGISLGPFSFVSKWSGEKETTVAHEFDGHTVDSKIFGPLYLFVVGIPSLLNAIFGFTKFYHDFYTEKWANKHAGLVVVKYESGLSTLRFKKEE